MSSKLGSAPPDSNSDENEKSPALSQAGKLPTTAPTPPQHRVSRFKTYVDYLNAIEDRWPEYFPLRQYLELGEFSTRKLPHSNTSQGHGAKVFMVDIFRDGTVSSPSNRTLKYDQSDHENVRKQKLGDFKAALLTGNSNLVSRILLIDGANRPVDPLLVDLLGLTFDIEPEFFLALLESYPWWNERVDVPSRYYKPSKFLLLRKFVFKSIKFVDIGSSQISLGLTFIHAKWNPKYTYRFAEYIKGTPSIFGWEREYAPEMTHPGTLGQIGASVDTQDNEDLSWSHIFAQWFVHNYRNGGPSSSNIPLLHCLQLLGRLQISRNQSYTLTVTRDLRNWKSEHDELEDHEDPPVEVWREIRENLEIHKSFIRAFTRYISCNFDTEEAKGFFEDLYTEQDDVMTDLRVVESEFKDTVQMHVGSLSLADSRKSIEMSKESIEEGKRIKLLTMLAFFFIPVSLATSIYGMNIQQINQTGHDMWVFVVTAIALLAVALLAWALSFLINSAWTNWRDSRRDYPSREYDSFLASM